jgi:hypothetical protein
MWLVLALQQLAKCLCVVLTDSGNQLQDAWEACTSRLASRSHAWTATIVEARVCRGVATKRCDKVQAGDSIIIVPAAAVLPGWVPDCPV